MTQQKEQPRGWICEEEKTGALDGIYFNKGDAENQCGYKQAIWKGSTWSLKPAYRGDSITENYHREQPAYNKLLDLYGNPDYKAGDKYDRAAGNI